MASSPALLLLQREFQHLKRFPQSLDYYIHVAGINLHAVANATQTVGGQQRCARTEERIVDNLPAFEMIENWLSHKLKRLLCAMPGCRLVTTAEGIQIRHFPQRRLLAIS